MPNPTIEDLQNQEQFELIAELEHSNIKEFVIDQLAEGGRLITVFMIYQILMMITGIFFITRSIILAYNGFSEPLIFTAIALAFSFSLLIPIHELLHGLALKFTGAKKVHYGAYLRKFIFYADADRHILNKAQFELIALAPFVTIKGITLVGMMLFFHSTVFYPVIIVMVTHSFFCAGDIGLLSIFYRYTEVYTYDVRSEKKSYYFKRK